MESQDRLNEKSYQELLLGKEPNSHGGDPRWRAVKGIGLSVNIKTGELEKLRKSSPQDHKKIIELEKEIEFLRAKKERLKTEIHEDEKKRKEENG